MMGLPGTNCLVLMIAENAKWVYFQLSKFDQLGLF